jgi:hypothetical protein
MQAELDFTAPSSPSLLLSRGLQVGAKLIGRAGDELTH